MKQIPLTQGLFAMVDDADFEFLNQWKWYADKSYNTYYAVRNVYRNDGSKRQYRVKMHRILLGVTDPDIKVDHEDGDGLNNRRYNLRPCSNAQNCRNRRTSSNNSTGYTGVSFYKDRGKYGAYVRVNNKHAHLGFFETAIEAAKARNDAAILHYGEFAWLNKL